MKTTRYPAKDLRGMSLKRLAEIGTELGVTFTKNHSREKRAKMILEAYNEQDLQTAGDDPPSTSTPPAALGAPKPEFERLIDEESDVASDGDSAGSDLKQRGGERPGAGRTEGMTAEYAAYKRLSPLPHPAIKAFLERFFDSWSARVQCPEIKLSKEEAVTMALAWTHAYEISPLAGRMPPWVIVLIECGWTGYVVIGKRLDLSAQALARRRAEQQAAAATPVN